MAFMKKLSLLPYTLIFLISLPPSYAKTSMFSGSVITGTDKIIDGSIFRFAYDDISSKVFVQTPMGGIIVENGACNSNTIFKVCISRANFSYRNITTYESQYEIGADIYKLTGSLLISRQSVPKELLPRESAELAITISNPTDFDITNISYMQDLSPFSIANLKGCTLDGNIMEWHGSIKSKFDKTCTATITSEKEGTYNLAGNMSYFNGFDYKNDNVFTPAIRVLAQQLNVNQITENNIEIKQPFYINMSLKNANQNEKIEIAAAVLLPGNLELLKNVPGFTKDSNILKQSLTLDPGSEFNYSLYLNAPSEAETIINQNFDYSIKSTINSIKNITFIKPIEPKPMVSFNTDYKELVPGQKFIVVARIKNPSRIYGITDIKAKLTAPYNNEIEEKLGKLMPNDYYYIISNTLIIPKDVESELGSGDKPIKLNLNVEYKFNGITKSFNKQLEFKIIHKPADSAQTAASLPLKTTQANPPEQYTGDKSQSSAAPEESVILSLLNKKEVVISALAFDAFWFIFAVIIVMRIKKEVGKSFEKKDF